MAAWRPARRAGAPGAARRARAQRTPGERPARQRPVLDQPPVGRKGREAVHIVLLPRGRVGVGPAAQQRGAARPESDLRARHGPRRGADRTGLQPRWRGEAHSRRLRPPPRHRQARPTTRVSREPPRGCEGRNGRARRGGAQIRWAGLRRRAAVRSLGRSVAALSRARGLPQSAEREGVGVWTGSPRLPERLPRQCCRARPTTGGGLCRDTI